MEEMLAQKIVGRTSVDNFDAHSSRSTDAARQSFLVGDDWGAAWSPPLADVHHMWMDTVQLLRNEEVSTCW